MAVTGARPATWLDGLTGRLLPPARVRRQPRRSAPRSRGTQVSRIRREAIGLPIVLAAILLAAGLGLFQISLSANVSAAGYSIGSLEDRLDELEAQRQELLYLIGQAQSPDRIADRARQLSLTPIDPDSIRFASPLADRHP